LAIEGNVVVIGYSAGADSALLYTSRHSNVIGLVLLGGTYSGSTERWEEGDIGNLVPSTIDSMVASGKKVVVVDDKGDAANYGIGTTSSGSYKFIGQDPSRCHSSYVTGACAAGATSYTNTSSDLWKETWDFLVAP
jgi:pimeloyl-ACP methyl ester carboxylesterase